MQRQRSLSLSLVLLLAVGIFCPQARATLPGSSGSSFSVDNSGAARYEVPIVIPPGTRGIQPELSLSYSSSRGNGIMGLGWFLKGLSSINRCPAGLKTDEGYHGGVHHDATDDFCLGNQRLIAVAGVYGDDGTEYRTEIESYSKIISHGYSHDDIGTTAPSWFEVLTRDGKRYVYGNSPDSRSTPIGSITVHSWLLNRVEDRRGNFYSISYSEEPETWRQPTAIVYTGNDQMGVTPAFAVHFAYKQRPDQRTGYVAGGKYPAQVVLDSITTSANDEVARTYRLRYEQSGQTGRSHLVTLQECGSRGECFEPMRFDWLDEEVADQQAIIAPPAVMTDMGYHGTSTFLTSNMVDMNGDGLLDWVTAWRAKWGQVHKKTWLQTKSGTWKHEPRYTLPGDGASVLYDYYQHRDEPLKNGLLQDVNGDGLPDWVLAHSYDKDKKIIVKKTWINTGGGWWLDERYTLPDVITDTIRFPTGENHGSFVDLNGDGLVDWVTAWKGNYHSGSRMAWINRTNTVNGNVWVRDDRWILPGYLINYSILFDKPGSNLNAKLIDVNGDGLPDYVRALKDRSGNVDKSTFLNTGSGWRRDDKYTLPDLYIDYTQSGGMVYGSFVDVNGDGLMDWVRAYRNPWGEDSTATFLNTGRGWLQDGQYRMQGVIYDYTEYAHRDPHRRIIQRHGSFVDINSDGLVDWVQSYRSRSTNMWNRATWINTGTTWANRSDQLAPEIIHDYSLLVTYQYSRGFDHGLFADINGDGSQDWVQSYRDRNGGIHKNSVKFRKGGNDRIARFSNEIGAEVRVEYKPMTDSGVYEDDPRWNPNLQVIPKAGQGDTQALAPRTKAPPTEGSRFYDRYPVRKAASTKAVVARAKTASSQGWRTWEYRYGLSKYDIRYGWQGFAWLKRWDVDKEVELQKSFYQDYPLTGRLKAVENKEHVKLTQYAPIGAQARYSYLVNGAAPQGGCDRFPCTVLLQSRQEEQYELDSSLVTQQTLYNDAFDAFGNITRQRLIHRGHPELKLEFQATTSKEVVYENRTDQWLLGLPVSEKTTFAEHGKADRSRMKEGSFNQYGEPESLQHDPDNPDSLTETFSFDSFGNVAEHTVYGPEVEARTTTTEYDASGHHPLWVSNSLGHRTVMDAYQGRCGEPTSVTDPNGLTTTLDFDQWCRLSRQIRADGTSTTHAYGYDFSRREYFIRTDTDGYPPAITEYDFLGRLQREETFRLDRWLRKEFSYDIFNRKVSESTPHSSNNTPYFTSYAYDRLDRIINQTTPDGATSTMAYNGLTTVVTNPLNQTTTEERGSRGEILRVIDTEGHTLSYAYDATGNLVSTRDPHGNTIEIGYDALDRKISMHDPDLGSWQYSYNAFGELVSQADGKGQVTTMTYDQLGRMTDRTSSDGTSAWIWDTASGGIGQLAEARGNEYDYLRQHSYDQLGRPSTTTVSVEGGGSFTTTWQYDAYSRLEQVIHPDNIIEQHTYTSEGTLYHKTISQNGETLLSEWQLEAIDDWGHAVRETINGDLTVSRSYDPRRGRIDRTTATVGEQTVQDLSYAWDPIGNLNRRVNEPQQQEELFDYDQLNRLVASRVGGIVTEVEYDAIGNILWKSDVGRYTYGQNGAGPHAVTMVDTSAARNPASFSAFNPAGNYTYDNNGNLQSGGGRNVEWTGLNMPRRITGANGVDSYFLYGPEGQRIVKDTADGKLRVYLSEVHELELDANDRATSRLTLPLGSAFTELLITDNAVKPRYMLLDHLGSPEVILDQDLMILEQLSFDPWGKRRQDDWSPAQQVITSSTPTGFTGHEMDDETGLINMAARLYDPVLGRFLSADTMIPNPGNLQSFNRYSYVLNNPLRYVDPTGHEEEEKDDEEDEEKSDYDECFDTLDEEGADVVSITNTDGDTVVCGTVGGPQNSEQDNSDDDGLDPNGYDFGGEGNAGSQGSTSGTTSGTSNNDALDSTPAEVEANKEPTRAAVVNWSAVLNVTHHALAVAGLTPLVGVVPDLLDIAVYGFQGDAKGMMVAGLAAVPGFGQGARGVQYGAKAARGIASKSGASLDDLSKAASAADRNNLTKAGRALQKHGDRAGSAYPQVKGGPAKLNPAGQDVVDDILTTPGSTMKPNRLGGVDVKAPDGRAVRYDADGILIGLREP